MYHPWAFLPITGMGNPDPPSPSNNIGHAHSRAIQPKSKGNCGVQRSLQTSIHRSQTSFNTKENTAFFFFL